MKIRPRFPIRIKILITLLMVVTSVVSVITFTMANLFHDDKKLYINDLIAMVSVGAAQEARSVLTSYADRLMVYARIVDEESLFRDDKTSLLEGFFGDFPELVALTLHGREDGDASIFNVAQLDAASLTKADFERYYSEFPIPLDQVREGKIHVRNSTLSKTMPSLTLAVPVLSESESGPLVASAVIRLDSLLTISARESAYDVFLVDSAGEYLTHPDVRRVIQRSPARLRPEVAAVHDSRSSGLAIQYVSKDGVEVLGGFSGVGFGQITAGAEIQRSAAFLASRDLLGRLLLVSLGLLLLSTVASLVYARRITRPVECLSGATQEIGKGAFDIKVDIDSRDEMGDLAQSFNRMAIELKNRHDALCEAQGQLIQSEKMAAFGQLGAGIAHEVKNPLAGILGCAQLSLRKAEPDSALHGNLKLIEKETKRCKTIIENLLKFARQEKALLEPIQVNTVLEDAMAIVNHQLELNKVKLDSNLATDLPQVRGNANQLQQVFMNLMINAQQAMEGEPGEIFVSSRQPDQDHIEVEIRDTGPGMTPEVRDKLFEPFFTTKPNGKGTGLGLSVSFGIVRDHAGKITVESKPGAGATFKIAIPVFDPTVAVPAPEPEAEVLVEA